MNDALRSLSEAREAGLGWVLRADLADFFERVPRWPVIVQLQRCCADAALVDLVRRLVHRPRSGRNAPRPAKGRGLHQGSPLSPLLANLYLDTLDRRVAEAGYQPIRFADDIAIPVRDRADGELALLVLAKAAQALELELNLAKSAIAPYDAGIDFLGQTLTSSTGSAADQQAHPLETTVFVTRQGALLRSRGERMVVVCGDETLARLNLRRVRQVICFGRVGMTTSFLHQAMKRGIDVVLLEETGRYVGRVQPAEAGNVHVRRAQHRASAKPAQALRFARAIVIGKIQNMRVMLLRIGRRRDDDLLRAAVAQLEGARVAALGAQTLPVLLGHEGAATRAYFQSWQDVLDEEWRFRGRARRPPPDPVNAMLSFGYTLLINDGVSASLAAGLDAHAGFLHQPKQGRPSLALDLIEEFRPVIVDSVVLRLISQRSVRPTDFEEHPDLGCRMSDTCRGVFLSALEQRMLRLISYQDSGRRVSYRVAMHLQAKALAATLRDSGEYRALLWK